MFSSTQDAQQPLARTTDLPFYAADAEMRAALGHAAVDVLRTQGLVPVPKDALRRLLLRAGFGRALAGAASSPACTLVGDAPAKVLSRLGMTLVAKGVLGRAFESAGYQAVSAIQAIEMWHFRICCEANGGAPGATSWA